MFRLSRKYYVSVFNFSKIRKRHVWSNDNVVQSPFKDIEVPNVTMDEYLWRNLDKWPTKIAAVCGATNRSYTYEKMYRVTRIFGASLRKKFKLNDGDCVAIMMPNMPEYPIVISGALAAGASITTINPIYTAHEVQRQLVMSDTKLFIADPSVISTIKEALKLCQKNIPIIAVDMQAPHPVGTISYKELVDDINIDESILKEVKSNPDDAAFLPYSSGTTGLPKGVELTHKCLLANFEQQNTECRLFSFTTETNQDSVLVLLPMYHGYGLFLIALHKLSLGLKLVTLPKFVPEQFLATLVDHKINLLFLAPPMVLFLGSSPVVTKEHLKYVSCTVCGAAPLATPDMQKYVEKLGPKSHVGQGYGLTEAGPLVTVAPLGFNNLLSVGLPLPSVQLRVVDANFNNLGPNEMGELLIKSPGNMKGYKNNPEANKEVFLEGGWMRSGDIGKIDETGAVFISDRLKELIKVKAMQVAPAELESVLKEHPAVFDAGVTSVPDPVTGERPKAFVVLKPGLSIKEGELLNFVSERVAPYKRIKEIMFVDNIPKNPSGKILRRVLKDM